MKIMNEDWVTKVWDLSKSDDNSYLTDDFFQTYKMPIFHNLVITSTGISEANKNEITSLINNNGGTYTGSFKVKFLFIFLELIESLTVDCSLQSRVTDILITQPDQKDSQKFKAAVKCRKECLLVDWIKDSVSKGYRLPYASYRIYTGQPTRANVHNSTQISNKSIRSDIFHPDATQLSVIMNDYSIAETTGAVTPIKKTAPKPSGNSYKETLDNIDMSQVKSAKGCLDGCSVSV